MEPEKRYRSEIEYAEKWTGGILELRAYKAFAYEKIDFLEKLALNLSSNIYRRRCLIIPLPHNFHLGSFINKNINCLLITENEIKTKGIKKKWRVERIFREPGRVSAREAIIKSKFRANSVVWISKEKLMKITQRSLFIDQNFIEPLYKKS